jgi:hypothetical protein
MNQADSIPYCRTHSVIEYASVLSLPRILLITQLNALRKTAVSHTLFQDPKNIPHLKSE